MHDGDDVSVAHMDGATPDAPVLAILHGLEGTVLSKYAQGLMHQARARGWGAAMLIFRTCDGRIPRLPRLYHSGETTDTDAFLRKLAADRPGRPIHAVGVSLGGNVLLKWLGEQGDRVPSEVRRAVAVSAPFDLAAGAHFLERGFSRLYTRHFITTLRRKAHAALDRHPSVAIDRARMDAARTFWEYDDAFTGPFHGFAGADDYYARSSSIAFLSRIEVPTLLYSAEDDPFLPLVVLGRVRELAAGNRFLQPEFTPRGGHVGWVAGPPWAPAYHMEPHVVSWLARD